MDVALRVLREVVPHVAALHEATQAHRPLVAVVQLVARDATREERGDPRLRRFVFVDRPHVPDREFDQRHCRLDEPTEAVDRSLLELHVRLVVTDIEEHCHRIQLVGVGTVGVELLRDLGHEDGLELHTERDRQQERRDVADRHGHLYSLS